jgi:hypothetical protein
MSYLSEPEEPLSELSLSIFVMGYLDTEEAVTALKKYQKKIKTELASRKKLDYEAIQSGVSYPNLIAIEHTYNILKVNLSTVKKLFK